MQFSRGPLEIDPLFTTADLGLRPDASIDHVMKVFFDNGEAIALRRIEMPKGVLLLDMCPGDPASGAIYMYDRDARVFYFVDFKHGASDTLTVAEFEQLVLEYDLVRWTANPELAAKVFGKPSRA